MRKDIQALRAVAVLAVVLWHAEVPGWGGGFVGVDVFLVVSGFLMTRILVRDLEERGRPRLGRFFVRRARRLLPAAGLVLAVTAVLTWALLPVTIWRSTGWDILASIAYVSNWRFAWTSTDYLAAESLPSPVQHYWSLSVEEQFYLVLPLVLLVVGLVIRGGSARRRALAVAGMALALLGIPSLIASVASAFGDPDGSQYFWTTLRLWELALGGVVALLVMVVPVRMSPGWLRWSAFGIGSAAIVGAIVLTPTTMAFPGWVALIPTLGTALVLWADADELGVAGSPLAAWPVQRLGDISYSLYLWHWPLLVVALVRWPESRLAIVAAVALAVVLAALTWSQVEERVRAGRTRGRHARSAAPRLRARGRAAPSTGARRSGAGPGLAVIAFTAAALVMGASLIPAGRTGPVTAGPVTVETSPSPHPWPARARTTSRPTTRLVADRRSGTLRCACAPSAPTTLRMAGRRRGSR
ncbi:acyltransferase family protein [Ornithinimicrobium sp. Y1847]|uniref:acyltransferase family protein n=1 Tax=Ornithinimicrobium sp. Y1847 TaxID=3405419 RepID=UPI003B66F9BB